MKRKIKRQRIARASGEEIARRLARGEDRTDWKRVKAMSQAEVERLADEEEGKLPKGWKKNVVLGIPAPKKDIHIRLDADIVGGPDECGAAAIPQPLHTFKLNRRRRGAIADASVRLNGVNGVSPCVFSPPCFSPAPARSR